MSLDQLYLLPEAAQQAILNGPALPPPDGVKLELDNPPNRNDLGVAVTTVCLCVSTIAFGLAAYAKLRCVKKVHLEDFFVFASYGLSIGVCYCLYETLTGVGFFVHQWNVRVKNISHLFYIVHVGSILYSVGIMLFKVAIILQWKRIFVPRGTKGPFYWTCHALLWINVLLYSIIVIVICASCKPFRKLWDQLSPGYCSADRQIIDISTAVGNLISDLVILVLPQRVIWKLQIKKEKKIGIAFIFFVGIFAIISAAFRVNASLTFYKTVDKSYHITVVAFWAISELTCAMLIYCVPSIPKVFKDSKLPFKLPEAFVSWWKLPSKRTKSGSGSTWPGFRTKQLPLDSLCEPTYDYGPSMSQYGSVEPKNWQVDETYDPTFAYLQNPQAGFIHTTEIVAAEEGHHYRIVAAPQYQQQWNTYGAQ
ncbi:hypothetical protein GGR52DRAFT_534303 [Hypoxylon sp. FL1284]|nr:hypothetical protein GGR52DRAFT_534303 [Hypoxylon sp. FL1284]